MLGRRVCVAPSRVVNPATRQTAGSLPLAGWQAVLWQVAGPPLPAGSLPLAEAARRVSGQVSLKNIRKCEREGSAVRSFRELEVAFVGPETRSNHEMKCLSRNFLNFFFFPNNPNFGPPQDPLTASEISMPSVLGPE